MDMRVFRDAEYYEDQIGISINMDTSFENASNSVEIRTFRYNLEDLKGCELTIKEIVVAIIACDK